jgi:hypothetical protein
VFDIKYHLKTNMSKMKLNLDESYEEYTTEELQLLDKFQEYSGNIFDDQEIYDVIVNCKFDEEKIKDEMDLMMKDAQRGEEYKWQTIEKKNDKDKKTTSSSTTATTRTKTNAVGKGKKEKKYDDGSKESAKYNGNRNNYYKSTATTSTTLFGSLKSTSFTDPLFTSKYNSGAFVGLISVASWHNISIWYLPSGSSATEKFNCNLAPCPGSSVISSVAKVSTRSSTEL